MGVAQSLAGYISYNPLQKGGVFTANNKILLSLKVCIVMERKKDHSVFATVLLKGIVPPILYKPILLILC